MDNIIIAQSGSVYDSIIAQLEENNIQLKSLHKEFEVMQKRNLQMSIQYEGCKKENRELKETVHKQDNIIGILVYFAHDHLGMFEQIFESDECAFQYPEMQKYLDIAEYMRDRYGRKTEYIRRVKERMNALNF